MLKGELVTLRPIRFEDWEKTIQWRNDMLIKNSTMSHPFPITDEQEQQWYRKKLEGFDNSFIPFAIDENKKQENVGFIHLNNIDMVARNAFFGVVIGDKSNFGKGFGKEAVSLILKYGFNNLNLHKIYCYVLEKHPALKMYIALGGMQEGLLKDHHFNQGKYENVCVLAWYAKTTETR